MQPPNEGEVEIFTTRLAVAEVRATEAEQATVEAQLRASGAEQQVAAAELQAIAARDYVTEANERATAAEGRAAAAELQVVETKREAEPRPKPGSTRHGRQPRRRRRRPLKSVMSCSASTTRSCCAIPRRVACMPRCVGVFDRCPDLDEHRLDTSLDTCPGFRGARLVFMVGALDI